MRALCRTKRLFAVVHARYDPKLLGPPRYAVVGHWFKVHWLCTCCVIPIALVVHSEAIAGSKWMHSLYSRTRRVFDVQSEPLDNVLAVQCAPKSGVIRAGSKCDPQSPAATSFLVESRWIPTHCALTMQHSGALAMHPYDSRFAVLSHPRQPVYQYNVTLARRGQT